MFIERGLTMKRTMMGERCTKSTEGLAKKVPHRMLFLAIACALALDVCPAMYGQATGSFSGATVTATDEATGLTRIGKTNDAGHYIIPLLPIGTYSVRVDSTGFQSNESKDLSLD